MKERGLGQRDTEKFVNWIYVNEYLFRDGEEMSAADERRDLFDARCRYIGKILKDIYAFKLARDFPHLQFVVSLEDGSDTEGEVSLTFWQTDK
ncbi:hypothetical protein [uncultured Parasphingopyxis sp.]|uniref:hypothetical protein n=1 Tax=uncultured Parasphingopyxis sp. TaxID=1547918 RepID=UPI002634917A|nr:hypothetical protein [uncultured Parasphingopyxis sp.]